MQGFQISSKTTTLPGNLKCQHKVLAQCPFIATLEKIYEVAPRQGLI